MSGIVTVKPDELHQLIQRKLEKAGLKTEHADEVAKHLVFAECSGIHSHGSVRVDYYAERIAKGGTTLDPQLKFEKVAQSMGIFHGDNGVGHFVANQALKHAISLAKETGVSVVGISRMGHSGTLSYYVEQAAKQDLIAISMCQSDPMVVPFGGTQPYYGTNPIAFAAPCASGQPVVFDMATSVQAWGKILDARSKEKSIPEGWAVNKVGGPTTDPFDIGGLLPIAGPKGYGLMMMIDILSGMLLGLPFGGQVSSMYDKLSEGRNLGQLFILIDPSRFTDLTQFKQNIQTMKQQLHAIPAGQGFNQVYYPGETSQLLYQKYSQEGIPVEANIYAYLQSDQVHFDKYDHKSAFV